MHPLPILVAPHGALQNTLFLIFMTVIGIMGVRQRMQFRRKVRASRRGNQKSVPSDDLRRADEEAPEAPGGYPGWTDGPS